MLKKAIQSLLSIFKKEDENFVIEKKHPQLDYTLIEDSGWKTIDQLPNSFNPEKEIFLVRYQNNPTKVFNINFDPETKVITNNWNEPVKKEKIAVFMVLSLNDKRWSNDELSYEIYYNDFEKNNLLVDLSNTFYHAEFVNTGNRYGICLCFYGNHPNRIRKMPDRWIEIPKAFKEV
jgi:hypothetical protein